MTLKRLWLGMQTNDNKDSGTDSSIVLIVNEDGFDSLHHTFENTSQSDQERGAGNVYEVAIPNGVIVPERLTNSSVRIGIRGADQWQPAHVFLWGERRNSSAVVPVAFDPGTDISTDKDEGPTSFPVRLIGTGRSSMEIVSFLIMAVNADVRDSGTPDKLQLDITYDSGSVQTVEFHPPNERGGGFFYLTDLAIRLPPNPGDPIRNRGNIASMTLSILGDNAWFPSSFFVFASNALNPRDSRPDQFVPLVHIPEWDLGPLSKQSSDFNGTARESIRLPVAAIEETGVRIERPLGELVVRVTT